MIDEQSHPAGATPADGLMERFIALLDLPSADPEVRDIVSILAAALESARSTGQAELLDDALRFARGRLEVRGLSSAGVGEIRVALERAATSQLAAGDRDVLRAVLDRCVPDQTTSGPPDVAPARPLNPISVAYVERLLQEDRAGAVALTRQCLVEGMDIADVLLDVLEPAQRHVGRLWAQGLISVAQEHFCTAVTQFVMTDLYPGLFLGEDSRRRLVAVHVPGSLHHVGLRMVVDVLECNDWSTTYVGEDISVASLPDVVAEARADLLLVSAAMPSHIDHVAAMIRAVRDDPRTRGVKIVVGGRPFSVAPGLADVVGADGWAPDARSAIEVCDALVGATHDRR